jgi:XTP/dITP diphosphohydrolase
MPFKLKSGDSLVIATHNPGKVWEFEQLFAPYGIKPVAASEFGTPEPEETGETFADNALLKASITAMVTGQIALADDSGLCVEALGGAPGVYSARWAGPGKDFSVAMARVQAELEALGATTPEARRAAFVCVLCLAGPAGEAEFFEGRVEGCVTWPARGANGFGYDPIFVPDGYDMTFGEMEPSLKYTMTHRARAFAKFKAACLNNENDAA